MVWYSYNRNLTQYLKGPLLDIFRPKSDDLNQQNQTKIELKYALNAEKSNLNNECKKTPLL